MLKNADCLVNSNLLSVTDGQNNTTNYVYNVRNLQTERIFADSQDAADKVVFTYDAVRRKTSQLDQKGDLISYQFDMANRMLQRHLPASPVFLQTVHRSHSGYSHRAGRIR